MSFDYFNLMKAITYAHVEAQGYKVSDSQSGRFLLLSPNTADGVSGTESAVGKVGLEERHGSTCLQGKDGHKPDMSLRSESHQNCDGLGAEWGIPPADSQISASTSPASGARPATLVGEGEGSVASPSFELPTVEVDSASAIHGVAVSGNGAGTANSAPEYLLSAEIVDKVYSKERIDFEMRLLHRTREEL